MIVKRNFNPVKIWWYIKQPMWFVILWSFAVWLFYFTTKTKEMALSFTPISVLGSALAIFIAFRNNAAYSRWWEARQIWGALVNHSREFARMVSNFVDVQIRAYPDQKKTMIAFKKELVYRQIAFVHALRLHLRKQHNWNEVKPFLKDDEYAKIISVSNKPNMINMLNGDCLRKGQDQKMLEWFHTFQIEGNLTQFAHHLGKCERIKNTPLPRQYDFFTRLFVYFFVTLLPFGLLNIFQQEYFLSTTWLVVPLSILIGGVFIIMERTGAANENPFENLVTDVPLTAICNTIERDLREMLGEEDLPPKLQPVDGYLF
ncbi:bestrophin family ion channel [Fulvivirgaceae bacterium BMA10]|uniref:Bestrophin family ion channel n=1 Tax=Splendidivirga corallicola TaxID=3051826 RepID=A0ABT8KV92_9BACT|nr:bestrophin family ion channel [Fulvivirgaceae bacterium BMA10]